MNLEPQAFTPLMKIKYFSYLVWKKTYAFIDAGEMFLKIIFHLFMKQVVVLKD